MTVPSGIRITALTIAAGHVGAPTSATDARSGVIASAATYVVATRAATPSPQRSPAAQVDLARPRSSSRKPANRATAASKAIRHSPTRMSGPGPTLLASTSAATKDSGTSTARTPASERRDRVVVAPGRNPVGVTVLMVLFILTYCRNGHSFPEWPGFWEGASRRQFHGLGSAMFRRRVRESGAES